MTVIEQLQAARGLIERGWCQGVTARNVSGFPVMFDSPDATTFCAKGACWRAGSGKHSQAETYLYRAVIPIQANGSLVDFNDAPGRTQAEVLKLFDDAIELAKAGEA